MDGKRLTTHREISKREYELGEAIDNLKAAKDAHKESLVEKCITDILKVIKDEGKLTEWDLNLFIGSLVTDIEHLYHKR